MSAAAGTTRRPAPRHRFPRLPLFTAFGLVLFSIAAVAFGRSTGIGTVFTPVTYPMAVRDVRFLVADDEVITVVDAATGETIEVIPSDKDGFIHGSLRGIRRDRKLRGIAYDEPYRLIRWDDGRLTLSDTSTGMRVQLDPFGPTNAGAYARFLEGRSVTP
jgi:putative photosynthetic complex assembly protein